MEVRDEKSHECVFRLTYAHAAATTDLIMLGSEASDCLVLEGQRVVHDIGTCKVKGSNTQT